jgi:hypothetical protein
MPTSGPQDSAWLEYDFTTTTNGPAKLALHFLPTFPVNSDHRLRYAVSLDGAAPIELDAAAPAAKASASAGDDPANSGWAENVLRNSAIATIPLGPLAPGKHTLRLISRDRLSCSPRDEMRPRIAQAETNSSSRPSFACRAPLAD